MGEKDLDIGDIAEVDEQDRLDYDDDSDYTEEDLSDVETGEVVDLYGDES